MFENEVPSGAMVSKGLFLIFAMNWGLHPAVLPWQFVNTSSDELRRYLGDADAVYPEELPSEPEE